MNNIEITLTVREIIDLAKCAGLPLDADNCPDSVDDLDTEYTIEEKEGGVQVGDENGKDLKTYAHLAYLTEYPDEGSFPLGRPLPPAP